ncbi:MAG: hypothetical protein KDA20_08610 [Phycisphaerales bacterium]|nr:hypothetical protein [Phycisphaerales bacterium]
MPKGPAADRPIDDPLAPVAVIQRRFYCFHQDPSPDDVSKLIKVLAARGWMRQGYVSAQVSGFVSVNAERYPESMRAWIDAAERDIPLENCAAVWRGIWNANVEGTEDVLRAYAEEAKDDSARNFIREMVRQPKWFMLDGAVISQLDAHRLIGALVASGDDAHLARVISTIELGTPSNIPLQAVSEQSAAANAKASLAAVCAMNDEILEKVKALKASAEGEMAQELEDVLITTEANRAAAEAQ